MIRILQGRTIVDGVPVAAGDAGFAMPGVDAQGRMIHWPVHAGALKGMLLLGDCGAGKTNAMALMARQLRRALGPEDVMVAIDFQGALSGFARPGDCVTDGIEYGDTPAEDSIHDAMAQGGRAVYVQCDPINGASVADWALDVALQTAAECGRRVILMVDNFERLTKPQYFEELLYAPNIDLILSMEGVDALHESWDAPSLRRLMRRLGALAAFRSTDGKTRQIAVERGGENRAQAPDGSVFIGNAIESWDVQTLDCGQAILCLPGEAPFTFRFKQYQRS